METDLLLQLAESFLEKSITSDSSKTVEFREPFSAGESLELAGSVVFHREVDMAGHTLRVYGNVHCKSSLHNASLLAFGTVKIDGESKNCNVFSHDSIHVHHSVSSNYWSYGDIHIAVEAANSSFTAAGSIEAPGATVRGGRLASNGNITVDNAYSLGEHTRLSLILGDRKIIMAKISAIDAKIKYLENDLVQVKECIDIFARKIVEKRLIGVHIPQFDSVKQQKVDIEKEIERQKAVRDQLMQTSMSAKRTPGTIIIRTRASNDLFIEIEGSRYETDRPAQSVMFSTDGHQVIMDPYYAMSAEARQVS